MIKLNPQQLGARIRSARHSYGWTQTDLGSRVGVAKTTVANWEAGRQVPPTGTVLRLSIALRRTVDWLLTGKPKRLPVWKCKSDLSLADGGNRPPWFVRSVTDDARVLQPTRQPGAFLSPFTPGGRAVGALNRKDVCMTTNLLDQAIEAIVCEATAIGSGLKTVRLIPDGTIESRKGTFVLDERGAGAIAVDGASFDRCTPFGGAVDARCARGWQAVSRAPAALRRPWT